MGNLESLLYVRGDPEKIQRLAEGAVRATQRGQRLVQQLLTYARKQITRPETVNPNQLIADVENLIRRAVGEQIEVVIILSPILASARIDPAQFETAILNLVINSRDAMTDSGRITIETENVVVDQQYAASNPGIKPGPYVMIAVSDNGAGMSPAVLAKAFDPFFTTKEIGKGSGLGLSQVYGFTKTVDGYVKIHSELGSGTTVKLYLPVSSDRPIMPESGNQIVSLQPARGYLLFFGRCHARRYEWCATRRRDTPHPAGAQGAADLGVHCRRSQPRARATRQSDCLRETLSARGTSK